MMLAHVLHTKREQAEIVVKKNHRNCISNQCERRWRRRDAPFRSAVIVPLVAENTGAVDSKPSVAWLNLFSTRCNNQFKGG